MWPSRAWLHSNPSAPQPTTSRLRAAFFIAYANLSRWICGHRAWNERTRSVRLAWRGSISARLPSSTDRFRPTSPIRHATTATRLTMTAMSSGPTCD
ncbi:hypothetical protein Smp_03 [Stenotrophomonas phage Smp131]|uniref:Uncharacterized protein n=1 Tax=Stenotrophomonas phage Smp131 TaxID=1168563 RepID=V9IQG7_9CAUD|nr:hypothetical protein CH36_gp03 [Stenotrophomonas phage Smp131]AFJ75473.1 hypothetical protein Smp_03 [Stenotrophomonas phage Smp131]